MRRFLSIVLAAPILAFAGYQGYRALSRDHRYHERIEIGDRLLASQQPIDAIRAYSDAVALDPGEPVAYVKRADAYRSRGDLSRALADLETAASLSDEVLLISSRLADLCYESGRFDEAARHYERVLSRIPDSPGVLYQLGLTRFRGGREAEAIEALNRAAQVRRDFWEAYYLRGAIFRSIGGTSEAEKDFRAALEIEPEAELAREALIDLYLEQNLPEKALLAVRREIAADPGDARAFLRLAAAHRLAGRMVEAIEAASRAVELDPNLAAAYLRLGELWLEEAERGGEAVSAEKALHALASAAKLEPENGRAALALGRTYLALGDEERAFLELQRASRATPIEPEALRLLGDLYRARRDPAEAVTAYHVYLKLAGDSPAVLENLGYAYIESGSPERGVKPLIRAAEAHLFGGDRESAERIRRTAIAANPGHPSARELLSKW